MTRDSSSSEEELEKLREAVDESFLPQHLYEDGNAKEKCGDILIQSLRKQNPKTTSVNPFAIKVTPEFQTHVSKRLSLLLDEMIEDTEIIRKTKKNQMQALNSGIKLLHSSKDYLKLTDSRETRKKPINFYKKKAFEKTDFEKRSREVAVSPEWVLSKEEIKHWAPETKGEVEIVKLDESYDKLNFSRKKIFASKHR